MPIHKQEVRSDDAMATSDISIHNSQGRSEDNNYNNDRELTERFRNLKAIYNLKKNIHCTNTHNYTNQ